MANINALFQKSTDFYDQTFPVTQYVDLFPRRR